MIHSTLSTIRCSITPENRRSRRHPSLGFELLENRYLLTTLNILWDDAHDDDNDELSTNYSEFRDLVTAAGHTISELEGAPGSITPDTLEDVDVLMLFDGEFAFTTVEITTIQNFASVGGSVFVVGERSAAFNWSSYNSLLSPYGIQFLPSEIESPLTAFNSNLLTAGLTSVTYARGGELSVAGAGTKVLGSSSSGHIGYAYGDGGRVDLPPEIATSTLC